MGFEHFELPAGQSADLRTSLTHGQHKTILRGVARANADPASKPDVADGYLVAFVISWSVRDENGNAIEWPADDAGQRAALERAPELVTQPIFERTLELYDAWRKDADPNGSATPSDASSPA